jgi:hypothetical protein
MLSSSQERLLRWLSRIYGLMLLAYPSTFQREYSREMVVVFRTRARDVVQNEASWALLAFWLHIVWDWLRTIVRERNEMETDNSMFGIGVMTVAAIPAIAFALHDLVFQLPDNQHEPTLGFFITVGGLLFVWGLGGYLAAPRVGGFAAAMKSGAVAGMMSVGILWLTSIVLNNLFIDRMSYEPDRIRAFQESGYATMRAYVNSSVFDSFTLMLLSVAAVTAAGGAALRHLTRSLASQ